jgi:hypothetical protein
VKSTMPPGRLGESEESASAALFLASNGGLSSAEVSCLSMADPLRFNGLLRSRTATVRNSPREIAGRSQWGTRRPMWTLAISYGPR